MNKFLYGGLLAFGATGATSFGGGCTAAPAPTASQNVAPQSVAQKPNIIFVLADDLGYGDLSCYGGQGVQTTNIDRLAIEGLRFTQFYVNAPICSPSRVAFTTGQYPQRWSVTSYIDHRGLNEQRGMEQWLDPQAPSLARFLKQDGYTTGHFGKWHMGGGRNVGEAPLPTEYGFDASLTQFEGLGDRVLPLMSGRGSNQPEHKMGLGAASEELGRGEVRWVERSDVTKAFVDGTLDFIKQAEQQNKPFYVNVWPDDPHTPLDPPAELRGDGSKKDLYHGVVKAMDNQLGALFDYVRENPKLRDNTIIIFSSDNGPEPGAGSAGPFRGAKAMLYEGGVREPFIVWAPGRVPEAQVGSVNTSSVFAGIDLAPSLLNLTITQAPATVNFDGENLGPTLIGQATNTRTKPLFWKRPPDRLGPPEAPWPAFAVRDGDWKLLMNEDGSQPQLYNVEKDKGETTNLAATEPQVVQRLTQVVLEWNRSLPAAKVPAAREFSKETRFTLKKGDSRGRFQAPAVAGRGFTITAKFDAKAPGGVIVAQGGVAEGYTLFLDQAGKLTFLLRAERVATSVASPQPVTGAHTAVARLGADRSVTLSVDGKVVAQGQAPKLITTQPLDDLNVGSDSAGAIGPYETPFAFNGDIESVVIELEAP